MNSQFAPLRNRARAAFTTRVSDSFNLHNPPSDLFIGWERRLAGDSYHWEGNQRTLPGVNGRILCQISLQGMGIYRDHDHIEHELPAGFGFVTKLPSNHAYYLPKSQDSWEFIWLMIAHPYVMQRLERAMGQWGNIFQLSPEGEPFKLLLILLQAVCARSARDAFAEEGFLFEWMLAMERHFHDTSHPPDQRERLLAGLRAYTHAHLPESFGVSELASAEGVSRSYYSRRFHSVTGMTPASAIQDIRLEEVRRLLRVSRATLNEVSDATGFADPVHLCKVFRRRFQMTPGQYRDQAAPRILKQKKPD